MLELGSVKVLPERFFFFFLKNKESKENTENTVFSKKNNFIYLNLQ